MKIELIKGVNIVPYSGTTCRLPDALTNIKDKVKIIWAKGAWTNNRWWMYDVETGFVIGQLNQLEQGKAYSFNMIEACTWELPEAEGKANLSGRVKSKKTKKLPSRPLSDVKVSRGKGVTYSDSGGNYRLEGLKVGPQSGKAEKNGYKPKYF